MSYAVKIGTREAIWIDNKPAPEGWVLFKGVMRDDLVWGDDIQNLREPNAQELADAARAAIKPVTRRQMLTALHRAGLLTMIKGAVAASGDIELQIAFDESQEFQRNNPFLATMAAALGKTDAEVDAIFALAATL